ncbi:MAG: hypothetical protein ACI97A_000395 [Planctomycetota bacterium]|jgi:hypothetical protein
MKIAVALILACSMTMIACESSNSTSEEKASSFSDDVSLATARFKSRAPVTEKFFADSYAYAIFPNVGKGAIGLGAAHGSGHVIRDGAHIANAELSQVSIGLSLGGQEFSEIVFFKDEHSFVSFKRSKLEFGAQASAVAVKAGVSTDADYENGVAVFTMTKGGAMVDASIGGQEFKYEPIN